MNNNHGYKNVSEYLNLLKQCSLFEDTKIQSNSIQVKVGGTNHQGYHYWSPINLDLVGCECWGALNNLDTKRKETPLGVIRVENKGIVTYTFSEEALNHVISKQELIDEITGVAKKRRQEEIRERDRKAKIRMNKIRSGLITGPLSGVEQMQLNMTPRIGLVHRPKNLQSGRPRPLVKAK